MKIDVVNAKEQIGKHFPFQKVFAALELGDVESFPWSQYDIHVRGDYWFDGQNLRVAGEIAREGEYECSRCLIKVDYNDVVAFNETFSETVHDEDGEFLPYEGKEIDLSKVIRETLIVNEPTQVICQEDCKGLCQKCGANLNEEPCQCDALQIDPRLAVLRELLKNEK